MYTKIIFILSIWCIAAACKKNETSPSAIENDVYIRIENETNITLDSVKLLYDTSNYNYGSVFTGKITTYHFFKKIPDYADASVIVNNMKIMAGLVVPPNSYPTPYLKNGNYTLQIFRDAISFSGYDARFIKN